jgi:hypothetical protein
LQEIKPSDVIKWQNEIMSQVSGHGRPYSPVYLKTIHNQLSTIFNHAEKLYGLQNNPARQAGNMGKERNGEMLFWTKEEYLQFIEGVADKPMSYYAFRLSPEENEELNRRFRLSGFRTKQEFIIQSVLHQKVIAMGNPLMMVQFRKQLLEILQELQRIQSQDEMQEELLTPIRTMLEILEGFEKSESGEK